MYLVQTISSAPTQKQTLVLPDGSTMTMTMSYYPQQYAWFITSLVYKSFTINGLQITTNPNMLHQWRNSLTFGLGCFVSGNREPTQQQDFQSGAAKLYILSSSEVASYTKVLSGSK